MIFLPLTMDAQENQGSETPIRTLQAIYEAALKNIESVAISEESIRQAEALYNETIGTSLPNLSFQHSTLWQEPPPSGGNVFLQTTQSHGGFQLQKLGLTGYREWAAIKAGHKTVEEKQFEEERAEQLLLQNVASAYFNLQQANDNFNSTQKLIDLAKARLKEIEHRINLGRSREAESIEQDYQVATLQAQLEVTSRSIQANMDLLTYLAGVPIENPFVEDVAMPVTIEPLQSYLERRNSRPDVKAGEATVEVAKAAVKVDRADYLPQINMTADYYLYRPQLQTGIDWDAILGVGVPLFTWGATKNEVKAAQSVYNQQVLDLRSTKRQADLEIQNDFKDFISAQTQLGYLQKAVDLARHDYKIQLRDDKLGLVTSLDVIESLNRLNLAEVALTIAKVNLHLSYLNLKIASGETPEETFK